MTAAVARGMTCALCVAAGAPDVINAAMKAPHKLNRLRAYQAAAGSASGSHGRMPIGTSAIDTCLALRVCAKGSASIHPSATSHGVRSSADVCTDGTEADLSAPVTVLVCAESAVIRPLHCGQTRRASISLNREGATRPSGSPTRRRQHKFGCLVQLAVFHLMTGAEGASVTPSTAPAPRHQRRRTWPVCHEARTCVRGLRSGDCRCRAPRHASARHVGCSRHARPRPCVNRGMPRSATAALRVHIDMEHGHRQ